MAIGAGHVPTSDPSPSSSAATTRIFLVDDHSLVRGAVRLVLLGESDFEVVGEADTIAAALERVPPAVPDVVIMDINLPDGDGLDLCRTLKGDFPSLICLMLTASDDVQARAEATAAGASGFLLKVLRGQDLVGAVRAALGRNSR